MNLESYYIRAYSYVSFATYYNYCSELRYIILTNIKILVTKLEDILDLFFDEFSFCVLDKTIPIQNLRSVNNIWCNYKMLQYINSYKRSLQRHEISNVGWVHKTIKIFTIRLLDLYKKADFEVEQWVLRKENRK